VTRFRTIALRIAHVAALLFCAWRLIATSNVPVPARECFTGLADTTRIQVLLGPAQVAPDSGSSCAGLDGLAEGSTLVFDLTKETQGNQGCIGYTIQSFSGTSGVTAQSGFTEPLGGKFTGIHGAFQSPAQADCAANWYLRVDPATLPPEGQLVSPLDAGPDHPWIVDRYMFAGPGVCGLPRTDAWATCGDRFAVQAIAEIPPP